MIVGVFGQTGTGKSTLLKQIAVRRPRAIIIDPLQKLGHLGVVVETLAEFKEYWRGQFDERWRIVLQPAKLEADWLARHPDKKAEDATPRAIVEDYLVVAMKAAKAGCPSYMVVVDEVDAFGSAFSADRRIRAIADYGRNFGVSLAFAARRPACVDRTLTSQSDTLYVFRVTEPNDLAYFRDVIGVEATARLPALPMFNALRWCGVGQPVSVVNIGPEKTQSPASHGRKGVPSRPPEAIGEKADPPEWSEGDVVPSECIILTMTELAARFGFASTRKFRRAMIDSGRLPHRRVSPRRWMVPKEQIPAG